MNEWFSGILLRVSLKIQSFKQNEAQTKNGDAAYNLRPLHGKNGLNHTKMAQYRFYSLTYE